MQKQATDYSASKWRHTASVLLGLLFIWFLQGTVPFIASPTLGQAVWTTGFSQSFINSSIFTIHASNIGAPYPASIAFGLAGAYPAGLLIALGLHPSDAYAAMMMFWFAMAFLGAYRIGIYAGLNVYLSVLAATLWMSLPIVWEHAGYSMISTGISLLTLYFYALLLLMDISEKSKWAQWKAAIFYIAACLIAVFMDGYSFMMFAAGASLFIGYYFLIYKDKRKHIALHAGPVHVVAFALAYVLYAAYIGKPQFAASPIDFFRGWGLDLSFIAIPTKGIIWLWDSLGLSVLRSNVQFFGDASVWITTFSLPLIIVGLVSWWFLRKRNRLAYGFLLVALFGFYMSMGPSLKINSVKPEPMGALMPAALAVAPTGSALLSKYLPGFKNMRAAYRWEALGMFGLWALLVFGLALRRNRSDLLGISLLLLLIIMFLPNLGKKWQSDMHNREMFMQIDQDLVFPLMQDLHEGELVAFLPYRNDFLVNYLASAVGVRTYNIGGDKNLAEARKHWPETMRRFKMGQVDEGFVDRVLLLLARNEADAVILPYINMLWAAHRWPYPIEFKETLTPIVSQLLNSGFVKVTERDYYAIVRLNSEADRLVQEGVLEKKILITMLGTGNAIYPIKVADHSPTLLHVLNNGWYGVEPSHVWSSKEAQLRLPVPENCKPDECAAKIGFSVYGAADSRPVEVLFHGTSQKSTIARSLVIRSSDPQEIIVPLVTSKPAQYLSIKVPSAISPQELQGTADSRVLGVALFFINLIRQ